MNTDIAIVFASDIKARSALRRLWDLDEYGDLTVHGATVLHCDETGHIRVADPNRGLGVDTVMGVGLGGLLAMLVGPIGLAAGVAGAAALSVGAALQTVGPVTTPAATGSDAVPEMPPETMSDATFFPLLPGQSAVLAEISEDQTRPLDNAMKPLDGSIHRRATDPGRHAGSGTKACAGYLYPCHIEAVSA